MVGCPPRRDWRRGHQQAAWTPTCLAVRALIVADDVHSDEMGGVSPRRVLWLKLRCDGRRVPAIVACHLRGSRQGMLPPVPVLEALTPDATFHSCGTRGPHICEVGTAEPVPSGSSETELALPGQVRPRSCPHGQARRIPPHRGRVGPGPHP
jgi:hypothetical protein